MVVTALSPTDVWVFGGSGYTAGLGAWHFDGSTWTQQTGNAAGLDEASALSPANIWAIGGITAPENAIMHYNGTTWTQVKASALAGLSFHGILALPQNNTWLTANAQSSSFTAFVLHQAGSGWTSIKLPWRVSPSHITPDGRGGAWLTAQDASQRSWAVHVSATGQLSRTLIGSPGTMFGLAQIPGTRSLWGAGMVTTAPAGANAAIWAHGAP